MGVDLKYVCLSDLHLGARYSILTGADAAAQSDTLRTFGLALEGLLRQMSGPELPTLLLLGDVLDLGLSPLEDAAMGFQHLIESLFIPSLGKEILSPTIIYVPGNHDHRVWSSARDQDYTSRIRTTQAPQRLEPPSVVTNMFATPDTMIESDLLTTLMRSVPASVPQTGSVRVAYPNFGLLSREDPGRCVVFHHGHFIESFYRLASTTRSLLEAGYAPPTDISDVELQNATWIDFVWSSFGQTGAVGTDVMNLYTVLQDTAATDRFLSTLEKRIMRRLLQYVPMSGEAEVRHYAKASAKALLDITVERWADLERNSRLSVLSDDSVQGLRWYLEEPLHTQINHELGRVPDDVTFVFGHTHKPFQDLLPVDTYRLPVKIFNTGGWTFNAPDMAPVEGAAAVFVDDRLNVVSVRLYNDPVNDTLTPVAIPVNGAYPWDSREHPPDPNINPLQYIINDALAQDTDGLWKDFTTAAAAALRAQQSWVLQTFDAETTGRPTARGAQR